MRYFFIDSGIEKKTLATLIDFGIFETLFLVDQKPQLLSLVLVSFCDCQNYAKFSSKSIKPLLRLKQVGKFLFYITLVAI